MACHKRCSFGFTIFVNIIALALICYAVLIPFQVPATKTETPMCEGILFKCTTKCEKFPTLFTKCTCQILEAKQLDTLKLLSLIGGLAAGGISLIFLLISLIISCKLCCADSRFPAFLRRFITAQLFFTTVALIGSVMAMTPWVIKSPNNTEKEINFYLGWVAAAVLLVQVIMLISTLCCNKNASESMDVDAREVNLPIAAINLYTLSKSTVYGSKK